MNQHLSSSSSTALASKSLHLPVKEFMQTRGKRLRGALVTLSYSIAGGCGEVPSEIGQAIEWLHAGSLIIDDVQDESTSRRGRPTLHRQLGVPLAINAGNYMYFRALEFITASTLSSDLQQPLTAELVRAGRMCHEGQAVDLSAHVDQLPTESWHQLAEDISLHKTGVLVELAMRMGAIAAGAGRPLREVMGKAGCQLGVALQMRNDLDELADVVRVFEESGEASLRIDDLRNRRVTWAWGWLAQHCERSICERLAHQLGEAVAHKDSVALMPIAKELFDRIQGVGEFDISRRIAAPLRLLGEHIVEPGALARLRDCLTPIEVGGYRMNTDQAGRLEVPVELPS